MNLKLKKTALAAAIVVAAFVLWQLHPTPGNAPPEALHPDDRIETGKRSGARPQADMRRGGDGRLGRAQPLAVDDISGLKVMIPSVVLTGEIDENGHFSSGGKSYALSFTAAAGDAETPAISEAVRIEGAVLGEAESEVNVIRVTRWQILAE